MNRVRVAPLVAAVLVGLLTLCAVADDRVALVIDNRPSAVPGDLDGGAMAPLVSALEDAGFDVDVGLGLDFRELVDAARRLGRRSRDQSLALVYFAGAVAGDTGRVQLLPAGGVPQGGPVLFGGGVLLALLRQNAAAARDRSIVLLDLPPEPALADLPFPESLPDNSVLVAATADAATDGLPPLAALLAADTAAGTIGLASVEVRAVAVGGTGAIEALVRGAATDISLVPEDVAEPFPTPRGKPVLSVATVDPVPPRPRTPDELACDVLRGSTSAASFEEYLRLFPDGHCAALARVRIASLHESPGRHQAGLRPGTDFRDCPVCPEMVVLPAGDFLMGSPASEPGHQADEAPQHAVTIADAFAVGKYEVTNAEFVAFLNAAHPAVDTMARWIDTRRSDPDSAIVDDHGHFSVPEIAARLPVVEVSWEGAAAYADWLAEYTGNAYRLLTEAEWEYAARGYTTGPFSTGAVLRAGDANFDARYSFNGSQRAAFRGTTTPVGRFPANQFGLYDVHGNVWEWVQDCWNAGYTGAPADGSAWQKGDCGKRILRGGSAFNAPQFLRSAFRYWATPDNRTYFIGLRVARTLNHAAGGATNPQDSHDDH